MSMRIYNQQHELAKLIERHLGQDGVQQTAIPSLSFIRESNLTEPLYTVYKPSFCIIVQGEKEVILAQEHFRYGPEDYIVASVDLPVTGKVIRATSDAPYLALRIQFSPSQILEVLNDFKIGAGPQKNPKRAMFISKAEPSLQDAVIRLASLLDNPTDIPVLAPIFKKEILYRVLQGPAWGDA